VKAVIIENNAGIMTSPLKLVDRNVPEPRAQEVLIKVSKCGICHTDLHVVEGDLKPKKMPVIPGHQVVGTIAEIGPGASEYKKGDRVGVAWLHAACGQCYYCNKDKENLCDDPRFTGYSVDGGFAEYIVAKERYTYRIPDNFEDAQAAPLLCAGIIGYRSFRLSHIHTGEILGLYGFGASAHIVIQIARYHGCAVFVFSRSAEHRALAAKLGADWAGSSDDVPPEQLDASIIFAPIGSLYINALKVTKKGGTVASAGIHMSPIPQFPYELLYHERIMLSVANSTREDAIELLKLASAIPVRTSVELFPLHEANHALQLLKSGKINGAAVLDLDSI
jgi:alcohol dehydrogenase, propanol-preferring